MPRIRTTLLVGGVLFAVCVFGTYWLSALPGMAARHAVREHDRSPRHVVVRVAHAHAHAHARRRHHPRPGHAATVTPAAVETTPQPRYASPPPYPTEALRHHRGGTVVLRVSVQANGWVRAVSIARSSGDPQLDRAAAGAVRDWIFHPPSPRAAHTFDWPVRFTIDAH